MRLRGAQLDALERRPRVGIGRVGPGELRVLDDRAVVVLGQLRLVPPAHSRRRRARRRERRREREDGHEHGGRAPISARQR